MIHLKKYWQLNSLLFAFVAVVPCRLSAQTQTNPLSLPSYLLPDYSEAGRKLPPGVPREVDTNGNVVYVPRRFTTSAYRNEALDLVIKEANQVAQELKLPEELPINRSNIVEYHIGPFGFNYAYRSVGSVTTKNYVYYVSMGYKFCYLDRPDQNADCQKYLAGYTWRVTRIDTNLAYQLATQWLAAVHMDVRALNRDCRVSVTIDTAYVQAPPGKFVPIYFVSWIPTNGIGDAASVRLFTPTKAILQLRVEDPKYILRKPLIFTNLAALFPGVATIHTNHPIPPVYISSPPP